MSSLAPEKILWVRKGEGIAAQGKVPADAPFFKDHFPDFPILPGVLALEIMKQTAEASAGRPFSLKQIRSAKFSHYLRPGDAWESRLELTEQTGGESQWTGELLHDGRVAASARFVLGELPKTERQSA